jgi:hypothetical protein
VKKLNLTKTTETRVITTKQVEVDPGFVARHRVVTKVQASTLTREWPDGPRTSVTFEIWSRPLFSDMTSVRLEAPEFTLLDRAAIAAAVFAVAGEPEFARLITDSSLLMLEQPEAALLATAIAEFENRLAAGR